MSHSLCKIDKNMEQQLHQNHRMQLIGGVHLAAKSSYIWTPLVHFNIEHQHNSDIRKFSSLKMKDVVFNVHQLPSDH